MNPARIVIATPVDGSPASGVVSHRYHVAVRQVERAGAFIMPAELTWADDLSRGRSALVHYALKRPDWDWLLFWDDDVAPEDTTIVVRMIECAVANGHEILAAPYPRKRIPSAFPYRPLTQHQQVVNDCVEVDLIAIGFCLVSRSSLERMTAAYAAEWFSDTRLGSHERPVALFKQIHTDPFVGPDGTEWRDLMSEDYSFMHRARQIGIKVWMYVGAGSPVHHVGGHTFTGTVQELGNCL